MSSPTINRWGLNTFWYHFWYSDNYYSKLVQQDFTFLKLLQLYLYFGLYTTQNFFINKYWFMKKIKPVDTKKYFRYFSMYDEFTKTQSNYRLRKTHHDVYPMKMWIMRYSNWLLINVYWFQPVKPNRRRDRLKRSRVHDSFLVAPAPQNYIYKRLKTILTLFLFKNITSTKKLYTF